METSTTYGSSKMQLIFTPDDSGTNRGSGYATVQYSSNADDETVVETTEDELATVFEEAGAGGATLDGVDASIDAAIEDPLSYLDYLTLEDGEVAFDDQYSPPQDPE